MTDLRNLPAIRTLAEERAREYVRVGSGWSRDQCWDRMLSTPERKAQIDAHLALLCDLTRPDSRDALVRLVERFGDASDADKARHHRDNPGELEALALAVLA